MRTLSLVLLLALCPFTLSVSVNAGDTAEVSSTPEEFVTPNSQVESQLSEILNLGPDDDLVEATKRTYALAQRAESSLSSTGLSIVLSVTLFLLITILRDVVGEELKGNTIRFATVVVGSIAAILGHFVAGYGIIGGVQLFFGGIGAISVHEIIKLMKYKVNNT